MSVDYLIVGGGYAGSFFALQCLLADKSFIIIDEPKNSASRASAGIVNPVVLKKFVPFEGALEQIHHFRNFIQKVETFFQTKFYHDSPVHRLFHDEAEQNLWLKKAKTESLTPFLNLEIKEIPEVISPFGSGQVLESGYFSVDKFFTVFSSFLKEKNYSVEEKLNYDEIDIKSKKYRDILWQNIIFAEGVGVAQNPFFPNLPIVSNKGQALMIQTDLNLEFPVKKRHFLVPVEERKYYYGGTYDRFDHSSEINQEKVEELASGLQQILPKSYHITEIRSGFRPTVLDRKPLVGRHHHYKNLWMLNGLGARGLLNGSFYAGQLFSHIENQTLIDPQVQPYRFENEMRDKR